MNQIQSTISDLKNNLIEKGFVHLTGCSDLYLHEVLNELGEVIMTTDVVVRADAKGLVTTAEGLDFHTDHHAAKYIAWFCHKQTNKGGESILIDALEIYNDLSVENQEQLESIELFEHKVFPDDKESHRFVEKDSKGNLKFYYSFWLVNNEDRKMPSLLEFQRKIKETKHNKILLKENDILIVDNHRIFHGRTPIEGSKDRFLKRFWIKTINLE